jgi:hypothetical protein
MMLKRHKLEVNRARDCGEEVAVWWCNNNETQGFGVIARFQPLS